jgi:hypothetical protein
LQEILYRLSGAAAEEASARPAPDKPGRFPVVVRPETRAFLEAQATYLGGSIAGVAGAILDGVAMATQGRDGGVAGMRGIAERFGILVQEHELSFPAAVEALEGTMITLSDFSSVEALQAKLSSKALRTVSERFHIEYDWLAGKSDVVCRATPAAWYKAPETAIDSLEMALRDGAETFLTLYVKKGARLSQVDDDAEWSRLPHFIPVLARRVALPGGESLETYEVWEEGRWSYPPCRDYIKLAVHFAYRLGAYVSGKELAPADYDLLLEGGAMPATILRRNRQAVTWHPDDYVLPESAVAKDKAEWKRIAADPHYKHAFKHLAEVMKRRGVEG